MSEMSTQAKEQRIANLACLHQQLEELAATTRRPDPANTDRRKDLLGPVIVVRGK